jgi:hypothetical protein
MAEDDPVKTELDLGKGEEKADSEPMKDEKTAEEDAEEEEAVAGEAAAVADVDILLAVREILSNGDLVMCVCVFVCTCVCVCVFVCTCVCVRGRIMRQYIHFDCFRFFNFAGAADKQKGLQDAGTCACALCV